MRITNQNEYYAAISKLRSLSRVVEPDYGEFAPGPDTTELEQAISDYELNGTCVGCCCDPSPATNEGTMKEYRIHLNSSASCGHLPPHVDVKATDRGHAINIVAGKLTSVIQVGCSCVNWYVSRVTIAGEGPQFNEDGFRWEAAEVNSKYRRFHRCYNVNMEVGFVLEVGMDKFCAYSTDGDWPFGIYGSIEDAQKAVETAFITIEKGTPK